MLDAIRKYFSENLEPGKPHGAGAERRLQLATAALLIEVSRVDNRISEPECEAISRGVQEKFSLSQSQTDELVQLAQREARESVSYYDFTSLINEHFSRQQKEKVIELMWRVAAAEDGVDMHAEALVRKVADLLYLPHGAFISAKLRVLGD
jgi:uncharacterized tellurite resistance protein B-like protein